MLGVDGVIVDYFVGFHHFLEFDINECTIYFMGILWNRFRCYYQVGSLDVLDYNCCGSSSSIANTSQPILCFF